MMKMRSLAALGICGALSVGCRGLLGLDDEKFQGTGGAGGETTTMAGGGGAGGEAIAGGGPGGTGGAACAGQQEIPTLDDDFDFPTCGMPDVALAKRGWHFTVQEEPSQYPDIKTYPSVSVEDGRFLVVVPDTFYWSGAQQGFLMYKPVQGDFLVVAQVKSTLPMSEETPPDDQAGAGILVRDMPSGFPDRWIAADRGSAGGSLFLHGTRSNKNGQSASEAAPTTVKEGAIAVCRLGGQFQIWFDEPGGWVERPDLLPQALIEGFSETVQVGLFAYDYNAPDMGDGAGVQGTFEYVHQFVPSGGCDPTSYLKARLPPSR